MYRHFLKSEVARLRTYCEALERRIEALEDSEQGIVYPVHVGTVLREPT